ncbi:MAG: HAMP domain-containing sensor histidine kinase [Flavobacteriaceae bacterium]
MKSFFTRPLEFRHRKVVHYTLLACMLLLQLLAVVVWYQETYGAKKTRRAFDHWTQANAVNRWTDQLIAALFDAQLHFHNYTEHGTAESLKAYRQSLSVAAQASDSLKLAPQKLDDFAAVVTQQKQTQAFIESLKKQIDDQLSQQTSDKKSGNTAPFELSSLSYKKILDSIKTNTVITVDKINRKGLLARLAAAFSGKMQVQKEQLKTVITMKYKDKVVTGTIEDLLKSIIEQSNLYYQKEFKKLRKSFQQMHARDAQLAQFNTQLLLQSQQFLPAYAQAIKHYQQQKEDEFKSRYQTGKVVKSIALVMIILLMLVISAILFGYTRLTYAYEERLQEAQEKIKQNLKFKDRMMGMISHEIRSPLSLLALYSRKVKNTTTEPEVKATFESIDFTTQSLLLLSHQLLAYSQEDAQHLSLKNQNFKLKEEISRMLSALTDLAQSNENKLKTTIDIDESFEVCADIGRIHQLFYNIVGNANKFTRNGTIEVVVMAGVISEYEVNLQAIVRDNGAGISPEELEHIFEPYYQGSASGQTMNSGVGLGLNLCKEIVELFDGEIQVESTHGNGTTVSFTIILSQA